MIHNSSSGSSEKAVFITGVGRSGTHFMAELFKSHETVDAYHLDDLNRETADSFWMYTKWYDLPVDPSPFVKMRTELVNKAAIREQVYCESNPYLALSIGDIHAAIGNIHIVILMRDPRKVVLSHLNKGWYSELASGFNCHDWKAPGYNYQMEQPNHFFGRILPSEREEYDQWKGLSQVGKIAWMWRSINREIDSALVGLERRDYTVINMDDFTYDEYLELNRRLGLKETIERGTFRALVNLRPGRTTRTKFKKWGRREEAEFLEQITLHEVETRGRA